MARQRAQAEKGRHKRTRSRDERGASTLELVILFPAVLLIIFGGIQAALYYHARNVALSAAQQGVRAAKAENGSDDKGRAAANDFLDAAGGGDVLTGVNVSSVRGVEEASVTVTGRPLRVIPGILNLKVSQTAEGHIEDFTSPEDP